MCVCVFINMLLSNRDARRGFADGVVEKGGKALKG